MIMNLRFWNFSVNLIKSIFSCGVGRTGTFICIDNMLRLAAEENIVDVFNYVNYMRTKRYNLVENEVNSFKLKL